MQAAITSRTISSFPSWGAALAWFDAARESASSHQRGSQREFDLPVQAAELRRGPPLKGIVQRWVDPDQD
jgi:hypothetical protein